MTASTMGQHQDDQRRWILRLTTNWALAVLTIPAAAYVFLFAMGAVMSTAGCTGDACRQGPGEFWFGILFYGAPVISVVTIAVSIFTARLRHGIIVPLCGLALLAIDLVVLSTTFGP